MGWSLKKALGWDFSPYIKREEELFEGVPKPTEVLVGMIIATIQKDLKRVEGKTGTGFYYSDGSITGRWKWSNDFLSVSWRWEDRGYSETNYYFAGLSVLLKDKPVSLSLKESSRLEAALKDVMRWKWEYDKNKVEMDRQQEAVNLIEEFFKPKSLPKPEEEEPKDPFVDAAAEHAVSASRRAKPSVARTATTRDKKAKEEFNELSAMVE